MTSKLRLFHYWRSSSSWRVRWGLAIKGIQAEMIAVNLLTGESESTEHKVRNPLGYVPVLEFLSPPQGPKGPLTYLAESVAILEWLDEAQAAHPLYPRDAALRARTRWLCEVINAGTQPLQNLSVADAHSSDPAAQKAWNQRWTRNGLTAFETLVKETAGNHCVGDSLTAADLFLIPQCYNALRQEIALETEFPLLARLYESGLKTESCQAAHPDRYAPSA